nr:hypothetical protein [uncultured bacterium]AMP54331.1 hypothetical protein [uncultured bacterium]AMP54391.1 hypothetical protein [uncultured bacterium]AMP54429.1 hypothetical protein [uncultured bacterium]
MRIRSLKPEFFRSESLSKVTPLARMTFMGLWTEADDYGRGIANPRIVKGALWSLDDDITVDVVTMHLNTLASTGHINLYKEQGDEKVYFVVNKFVEHQSAAFRRGKAKYPDPDVCEPVEQVEFAPIHRVGNCPCGQWGNIHSVTAGTSDAAAEVATPKALAPEKSGGVIERNDEISVPGEKQLTCTSGVTGPTSWSQDTSNLDDNPAPKKKKKTKKRDPGLDREDTNDIVNHFVQSFEEKIPGLGLKPKNDWYVKARLLIDQDGKTVQEIKDMIDWVVDHDFWSGAILSIPKFRTQWTRLQVQRVNDQKQAANEQKRYETPASNAPVYIPKEQKCVNHRGRIINEYGECRACVNQREKLGLPLPDKVVTAADVTVASRD